MKSQRKIVLVSASVAVASWVVGKTISAIGPIVKQKTAKNCLAKTAAALRESKNKLRHVSVQLLAAQQKERTEISMVLHDEFGQMLAVLKQRLWRLQKKVKKQDVELQNEVRECLLTVAKIIEDVRRISHSLSSPIMKYRGLTAALRKLVDDFSEAYNIGVTTELDESLDHAIPAESHFAVYRVFEEALNNVGKHALATHLTIVAKNGDSGLNNVSFLIEDNGVGFNTDDTGPQFADEGGLGLIILNEHVRMLGGSLDIWSQEGKGTRISFTVPASNAAA